MVLKDIIEFIIQRFAVFYIFKLADIVIDLRITGCYSALSVNFNITCSASLNDSVVVGFVGYLIRR